MKKFTIALFSTFALASGLSLLNNDKLAHSNSNGAPGQWANINGGPNCTNCHMGLPTQTLTDAITTDIPASGYIMGETYNITVSLSNGLSNKFGFQLAVRDNDNNAVGTLISPDNLTNLQGASSDLITHTNAGNQGANNSITWSFQWVAPNDCDKTVNFYASLMSTNNNNANTGDQVYLTSLEGIECGDPLSSSLEFALEKVNLYPNPFNNVLNISNIPNEVEYIKVFDLAGREIYSVASLNKYLNVDLSEIETGIYFVSFEGNNEILAKKKIIKH